MVEKRAQEQKLAEEKKHGEEINFLKRTNQQLKVRVLKTFNCLSSIFVLIWKILELENQFFKAKVVNFFSQNLNLQHGKICARFRKKTKNYSAKI